MIIKICHHECPVKKCFYIHEVILIHFPAEYPIGYSIFGGIFSCYKMI